MADKKENWIAVIGSSGPEPSRYDWPAGTRTSLDEHGIVEQLPDDAPVQYWVCCRVDQPWTWRILPNQHVGACTRCGSEIIYKVSEKTPTDPAVQKICRPCLERLAAAQKDEPPTR